MKKYLILLTLLGFFNTSYTQYRTIKDWSKETAVYYAKEFLFRNILDKTDFTDSVAIFDIIPLAAANSGELTTIFYRTTDGKKDGLILSFWGDKVNEYGVLFKEYSYINFDKNKAILMLDLIKTSIKNNTIYWKENEDTNLLIKFEDFNFVVTKSTNGYIIRVFWKDFDATWEKTSFERSVKRFLNNY